MLGHLYHPRFSDLEDVPASLSAKATGALRNENWINFDGVIVSDDMEMGAVREAHSPEDLAVKAVQTGTDIVIFSNVLTQDPALGSRLNGALAGAVCDGRISRLQVEGSDRRIVGLKRQLKTEKLPVP